MRRSSAYSTAWKLYERSRRRRPHVAELIAKAWRLNELASPADDRGVAFIDLRMETVAPLVLDRPFRSWTAKRPLEFAIIFDLAQSREGQLALADRIFASYAAEVEARGIPLTMDEQVHDLEDWIKKELAPHGAAPHAWPKKRARPRNSELPGYLRILDALAGDLREEAAAEESRKRGAANALVMAVRTTIDEQSTAPSMVESKRIQARIVAARRYLNGGYWEILASRTRDRKRTARRATPTKE